MSIAHPTLRIFGRRIAIDLPHLAFATAIAAWAAWLCWDAWHAQADVENLILIAPVSAAAVLLYLAVAVGCCRRIETDAEATAPRAPLDKTVGIRVAGSMALLAVFVVAGPLVGFDVASFVYVLAMLAFLGERRILVLVLTPALFCAAVIYGFNTLLATPLPLFLFGHAA